MNKYWIKKKSKQFQPNKIKSNGTLNCCDCKIVLNIDHKYLSYQNVWFFTSIYNITTKLWYYDVKTVQQVEQIFKGIVF